MPTTRPSDKNQDRSQWWKDEQQPETEGEKPRGPGDDNAIAGKTKFDEEQHPIRNPT